jgi:hypothetical protein
MLVSAPNTAQAIGTSGGVALRAATSSRTLIIDIDVSGLTAPSVGVSTYTQAQLIREQAIQYLWTWKTPQALERFAFRPCFALAYENDEIAIFHVDPNCSA